MTDHTAMMAAILYASSRNASYTAEAAIRDARQLQNELSDAEWVAAHERTLGLAASGCDEEDER